MTWIKRIYLKQTDGNIQLTWIANIVCEFIKQAVNRFAITLELDYVYFLKVGRFFLLYSINKDVKHSRIAD